MNDTITYLNCPVCQATPVKQVLTAKDYTVSGEQFEIWECDRCHLRFTQNIPIADSIGRYYSSSNYISHSNTSKGLVNRLYHLVRKITLRQKKNLLQSATGSSTGALLDIGAGTGAFASYMQSQGWSVSALEPDETARRIARETNGISLLPSDQLFQLAPDSFDAITLWHVLEHVHTLHEYIDRLKALLKQNGKLFIAVPNYTSYDAQHYNNFWAAYDVPRHLYHFSPTSMEKLLTGHGLDLVAIKPMWYDSFYVSLLSEKYKTGNGSLLKGGWTGLLSNIKTIFRKDRCSSLIYIVSR